MGHEPTSPRKLSYQAVEAATRPALPVAGVLAGWTFLGAGVITLCMLMISGLSTCMPIGWVGVVVGLGLLNCSDVARRVAAMLLGAMIVATIFLAAYLGVAAGSAMIGSMEPGTIVQVGPWQVSEGTPFFGAFVTVWLITAIGGIVFQSWLLWQLTSEPMARACRATARP